MFAKPYKLKSTNTLKNSEKKHLGQRIKDEFPAATDERVKELVPVKSNTSCLKLVLHSGETVTVYSVESVPIMIERESGLVPTLCALWQVPELVPTIVVQPHVLTKIAGGAPLYVPGVVRRSDGGPRFGAGAVIAAATTDNMAVGAVGRAAMSSGDLILRATGVLMEALHVCGDHLCRDIKFHKVERPQMSATEPRVGDTDQLASQVGQLHIQPPPPKEEWPALGRAAPPPVAPPVAPVPEPPAPVAPVAPAPNEPRVITEETAPADGNDVLNDSMNSDTLEEEELGIPADMDGLLRWCLLAFLKMQGKHLELPLKTNLLYKNHLFPLCPADRTLDVKKSSYKKLSKFLEAMEREGLLQVKEIDKGVSAITSVNAAHPLVRGVRVPAVVKEAIPVTAPAGPEDEYVPPVVREMLCVTAAVSELFHMVRKGTALPPGEVRTVLTVYVKTHQLKSSELKGGVTLDAMLAKICNRQEQEVIKWDALMSGVVSRMTIATEMTHHGGVVTLSKSRLEPVSMQVVTRSGNKKVTLVSNLEAYGFTLPRLSVACQRAVGASCGVTRSPGAKADQLMLQGDQTHFVAKLLIEKYGLPKKYVDGADKALNKKK